MKISKQARNVLIVLSSIVIVSIISFLSVIQYRKNRLRNIDNIIGGIKLASDPKVVQVLGQFPSAVSKMSITEVNDMYAQYFKYVKYGRPIPSDLKKRNDETFLKYFNI